MNPIAFSAGGGLVWLGIWLWPSGLMDVALADITIRTVFSAVGAALAVGIGAISLMMAFERQ